MAQAQLASEYQRLAELVRTLCQNPNVGVTITAALSQVPALRRKMRRRHGLTGQTQEVNTYLWAVPEETLPQLALYEFLDEAARQDDQVFQSALIHYVVFLVSRTMPVNTRYVAVAIGCFLYRYTPEQISRLAPEIISEPRDYRDWVKEAIERRFPQLQQNDTRAPSAAEASLVCNLLSRLAPWQPSHPNTSTPLETLFAEPEASQEGERIHVLVDMQQPCGLPALIREYNIALRETRSVLYEAFQKGWLREWVAHPLRLLRDLGPRHELPDPKTQLRLPNVPVGVLPPDGDPDDFTTGGSQEDPVQTPALSPEAITDIDTTLQHQQRRREQYRPGLLSVFVDGEPAGEFDVHQQEPLRLQVPRTASSVKIYGHDAEGPLLVAMFPITGMGLHEGRRTVTLLLSAAREEDGTLSSAIVELTYLESPQAALHALWASSRQQRRRLLRGRPGAPTIAATGFARGCQRAGRWMDWWFSTALGRVLAPAAVSAGLVLLTLHFSLVQIRPALQETEDGRPRSLPSDQTLDKTLYALIQEGEQARKRGDIPKAMAAYRTAVNQVAFPLNSLAWMAYKQGEAAKGRGWAELAVQLRPDMPEYLHTLVIILCALGEREEAIHRLEKAMELQSNNKEFSDKVAGFRHEVCQ